MILLPPDPWWLLRVQVPQDRDCVPFQFWILWHYQWRTCTADVC